HVAGDRDGLLGEISPDHDDEETTMSKMKISRAAGLALVASAVLAPLAASSADVDNSRLVNADNTPADWLTYHGTYKSWHYSGLDQINTSNVGNMKVAWSHVTPK